MSLNSEALLSPLDVAALFAALHASPLLATPEEGEDEEEEDEDADEDGDEDEDEDEDSDEDEDEKE